MDEQHGKISKESIVGKKKIVVVIGVGLALCNSFPILADNPFESTNMEQAYSPSKERIKLAESHDGGGKKEDDLLDKDKKSAQSCGVGNCGSGSK